MTPARESGIPRDTGKLAEGAHIVSPNTHDLLSGEAVPDRAAPSREQIEVAILEKVLIGLRSEEQTTQVRAITASVEYMRDSRTSPAGAGAGEPTSAEHFARAIVSEYLPEDRLLDDAGLARAVVAAERLLRAAPSGEPSARVWVAFCNEGDPFLVHPDFCPGGRHDAARIFPVWEYVRATPPDDAVEVLRRIVSDLPSKRDWLDPYLEHAARAILAARSPAPAGDAPREDAPTDRKLWAVYAGDDASRGDGVPDAAGLRAVFAYGAQRRATP
jgi:hypothetical protein